MTKREEFLQTAIRAATEAGNVLIERYNDVLNVSQKESLRDVVTQVDQIAEAGVIELLRAKHPNVPIISEENGAIGMGSSPTHTGTFWVVDALDGTVNYVNHVPFFSVSIALIEDGEATVGVIYNPLVQDLYYGAREIGAFKNQSRLYVKDKPLSECLLSVGFSGQKHDPGQRAEEFLLMGEMNDISRGCLRTGSAAMNFAFLAEGRFGACWGKKGKYWDVAGGLLLAELAGAKVRKNLVDREKNLVNYVGAVPRAWDEVFQRVSKVLTF